MADESKEPSFEDALKALTTKKQKQFVRRYLVNGFNATEASICAGYSPDSAAVIGHENLRKPKIKAAIDAAMREACLSSAEVLYRLSGMATASIALLQDEAGKVDLTTDSAKPHLWLVKKYERIPSEHGIREKVEMHDAKDALKTLAKHHGLLTDKVDVDITSGGQVITYLPTNGRKKDTDDT